MLPSKCFQYFVAIVNPSWCFSVLIMLRNVRNEKSYEYDLTQRNYCCLMGWEREREQLAQEH